MSALTTAIDEDEVIAHFKDVLAPYVISNQIKISQESLKESTSSAVPESPETIVDSLGDLLIKATKNEPLKEVRA